MQHESTLAEVRQKEERIQQLLREVQGLVSVMYLSNEKINFGNRDGDISPL